MIEVQDPRTYTEPWGGQIPMERFDDLIMWADMREGPKAVPGNYRARLTVGDWSQTQGFEILIDPRLEGEAADPVAEYAELDQL